MFKHSFKHYLHRFREGYPPLLKLEPAGKEIAQAKEIEIPPLLFWKENGDGRVVIEDQKLKGLIEDEGVGLLGFCYQDNLLLFYRGEKPSFLEIYCIKEIVKQRCRKGRMENIDTEYLRKVLEKVKTGPGFPRILEDEEAYCRKLTEALKVEPPPNLPTALALNLFCLEKEKLELVDLPTGELRKRFSELWRYQLELENKLKEFPWAYSDFLALKLKWL